MFYQLPPAGNKIALSVNQFSFLPSYLLSKQAFFYQSGTAALAAAILAAKKQNNKRQNDKQQAEVILPAYGCPDLVSAAIYAGIKPVLVDLETNRPWYDLAMLEQAVTKNTVAIVGVNLFGLAERWRQLRKLADQNNIVLIEDSAQYFPGSDEQPDWQGDLVVFSFGRGKPVCLLGGGAVYCQQAKFIKLLPEVEYQTENVKQQLVFNLKVKAYNGLLSPHLYWLPLSLPFLHLGETRYHVLTDIEMMSATRLNLLATNIEHYQDDSDVKERYEHYFALFNEVEAVKNLPQLCQQGQNSSYRRLLRYPILLEPKQRVRIFSALLDAGLGASLMYPASMPVIPGLKEFFSDKSESHYPNASAFAQQVLTLPMHANISNKTIEQIGTILKQSL